MALKDGPVELPEKLFYKIGEVAQIVGAEPHVLRYWEKEFSFLRPRKSRGGQRLYRRSDVEALLRIKKLLRDEGFTIEGARKKLVSERKRPQLTAGASPADEPDTLSPKPTDESRRLLTEIDRLKAESRELRLARNAANHSLAATRELLRETRQDLTALLAAVETIRTRNRS